MVVAGGGKRHYDAASEEIDYYSQTKLHASVDQGQNVTGYTLSYNSGAKDYYNFIPTVLLDAQRVALLTEKVDTFGHTNRFVYQETNNVVFLKYVIDADGHTNALSYTNTAYPAQITGVQDPFGRTTLLQYSATGILTNIIDVAGLTNSFKYDYQGWVTNLVSAYGTTTFQYSTNSQTTSDEFHTLNDWVFIRAVKIIDPMGGTNIYMLRQDSSVLYTNQTDWVDFLPNSYLSSVVPSGVPTTTLDNVLLYYRDTFHWGPRQATGLPLDLTLFTPANYKKARMRHWLHDRYTGQLGQTLDIEQAPSPDGIVDGQTTWYDYDGKTETWLEGASSKPSLIARVIPDGTTQYVWYRRDDLGRPTNIVQTYSTGHGSVTHTRTNINVYDANAVDLVKMIGPRGETLAGLAYNTKHQVLRVTNAVNDVEYYGYDAQSRLTAVTNFAGLATINNYFSSGAYSNWVQTRIDLQIHRTNVYSYTNDLLFIHTNELGLITTNQYDNLQRLTNMADSRGAISYTYNRLDLIRIVDRLGLTNGFEYDGLRRMTARTNALGFFTLYTFCPCGSLDSIRDAEGHYTYFFYDNAGRLINTAYADDFGVTNRYNLLSQLTNTIDSAGMSVTNWFNNQGLRYAVSNAFGCREYTAFDQEDRATNTVDANSVSLINTYDDLDRLRTRTHPDTGVEKFGYSARGLVAYTIRLIFTKFYAYVEARRKVFETNAYWEITEFQY
jgi:YD repeat-containing protein